MFRVAFVEGVIKAIHGPVEPVRSVEIGVISAFPFSSGKIVGIVSILPLLIGFWCLSVDFGILIATF